MAIIMLPNLSPSPNLYTKYRVFLEEQCSFVILMEELRILLVAIVILVAGEAYIIM